MFASFAESLWLSFPGQRSSSRGGRSGFGTGITVVFAPRDPQRYLLDYLDAVTSRRLTFFGLLVRMRTCVRPRSRRICARCRVAFVGHEAERRLRRRCQARAGLYARALVSQAMPQLPEVDEARGQL